MYLKYMSASYAGSNPARGTNDALVERGLVMSVQWNSTGMVQEIVFNNARAKEHTRLLVQEALEKSTHLWIATAFYHLSNNSVSAAVTHTDHLMLDTENLLDVITGCVICGVSLKDIESVNAPCVTAACGHDH
jgi:hypothetical protein